jgi:hypothetical protein
VVHRDEADGQQGRRPHLVERDERQQHVEPDVPVGEPTADVHQDVGADHQPEAHRGGAGDLGAQHDAQHEQRHDGGELAPEQPAGDPAGEPDGREHRHMGGQDRGDDAVPAGEAALVQPRAAGDAGREAGTSGGRRLCQREGHRRCIGARPDVSSTTM